MRRQNLLYFGMAGFLVISACHHGTTVVNKPNDIIKVPVDTASTPPAAKDRPAAPKNNVVASAPVKQQAPAATKQPR